MGLEIILEVGGDQRRRGEGNRVRGAAQMVIDIVKGGEGAGNLGGDLGAITQFIGDHGFGAEVRVAHLAKEIRVAWSGFKEIFVVAGGSAYGLGDGDPDDLVFGQIVLQAAAWLKFKAGEIVVL